MRDSVVHGGVGDAEVREFAARGITLIDLSANLNPYGPHPRVLAAARESDVARYPEAGAATLRRTYAASAALPPDQVLAGNGSSELLYLVARAAATAGVWRCVILGPTFGEYRRAAVAAKLVTEVIPCFDPPAEPFDAAAVGEAIAAGPPALVFACNPNNPTGSLLSARDVRALLAATAGSGGMLVLDEAYADFALDAGCGPHPEPGLLRVRSLTKLHAIPGLRVGFLVGEPRLVASDARNQPPWAVSAPAIAGALQALKEREFAQSSVRRIAAVRALLTGRLDESGFVVSPSAANFLLVQVGNAGTFRARLMGRGFVVRDCTSFGLPAFVRVAVPREDQVESLVAAMGASR